MGFTAEQKAKFDPEMRELAEAVEALQRNDLEAVAEHMSHVPVPAETLMALKKCGDADRIRRLRLNTSLADEKYGPGWLDRED